MTGRLYALAFVLAGLSAPAALSQPAYYAQCRPGDLGGTWAVEIEEAAAPAAKAFYAQYPVEYVRFGVQGAYMSVAYPRAILDEAAVNAGLDRADAADPASYVARVVDDQGRLEITRDGKPFAAYMCVMQDDRMIWTEVKGNPKVVRVQIPIGNYIRSR